MPCLIVVFPDIYRLLFKSVVNIYFDVISEGVLSSYLEASSDVRI